VDTVVVVEVLTRRDHVQSRQRVALGAGKRSFSVGRGAACDVIVDDPYAAPLHVLVEIDEGGAIVLTDQASVNGIWLQGRRTRGAGPMPLQGGEFRIGHTRIRVRMPHEQLAPERSDGASATESQRPFGRWVAIGLLACVALFSYASWLDAPRDVAAALASALLGFALGAGLWIAIWALLSRIVVLEWRWLTHAAILLCSFALVLIADFLFDAGLFAFDLRSPSWLKAMFGALAAGALLYLHLVHASPIGRRLAGLCAFLIPILAFGTVTWVEARKQRHNVNYVDASRELFPPYLRMRTAKPLEGFLESTAEIRKGADEKRRIAIKEGDEVEGEDE
jgi:pSer/pThr/pTyr-binding forkhead associated (FHA) protein